MRKNFLLLSVAFFAFYSCSLNSQNIIDEVKETFKGVNQVEVTGSFCYVEIIGGDRSDVDFYGEIKGLAKDGKYEIKHSLDGDKLKVWIERPKSSFGKITGKLLFKTPKNLLVNVKNSSGRVLVSNIENENLKVHASSGSVEVENIAAEVDLSCSSGSIKGSNIAGNADVHTSSGSQKLSNITGNVEANASSGRITLENVNGNVDAGTSSGSIHLANVTGQISAKASSGSIHGNGIMAKGNNTFKTSSGSIKIDLENEMKDVSFDLAASSGGINVDGKSYKKRFTSNNGEISISGHSSSGGQKYF